MKLSAFLVSLVLHLFSSCICDSAVNIGYQVTLAIPTESPIGFIGRAFLMQSDQTPPPNFRVAITVEAVGEKYSCSLDLLLGGVKVWSSGHLCRFFTTEKCVLELTESGDLRLKGRKDRVGWRTGTSGQGVKRLQLLRTGNLVLVDDLNLIKWQSFNFPTDIMLWGQRLSSETRLTSFPSNSTMFYSFEIQRDKIALFLNSDKRKYSYWEFKPSGDRNITYVQLTTQGLDIFSGKRRKIGQIMSQRSEAPRFLALWNSTGNFGLYYYSSTQQQFEASYVALNSTCDLPMACKPYGICTFSGQCSCIRLVERGDGLLSDCGEEGISRGICGESEAEMVEIEGVTSILKGNSPNIKVNVGKKQCANQCVDDCNCVAALYSDEAMNSGECSLYGLVRGVKQVERGGSNSSRYMVKVRKGSVKARHGSSGLKKWVAIVVGVVDGFVILLVLAGLGYYFIQKRRKTLLTNNTD